MHSEPLPALPELMLKDTEGALTTEMGEFSGFMFKCSDRALPSVNTGRMLRQRSSLSSSRRSCSLNMSLPRRTNGKFSWSGRSSC
jgi:hypothetical protein